MIVRWVAILLAFSTSAGTAMAADTTTPLWSGRFDTDWLKQWQVTKRKWGMDNIRVQAEPGGANPTFLRAAMPAGSASPTVAREDKAPLGGGQFYATLGLEPADSLHLRYQVRFPLGYDFVKGGKLPGLFGGTVGSGGVIPNGENGFTTRFMWRAHGAGEVYAYLPTSEIHGTSLGRGKWHFTTGRWHAIEQAVELNTPGKADGRIRVWFDDKLVLDEAGLTFRTTEKLKVEGIFFSTFFGGDDSTWATPKATHVDFAEFVVGKGYLGR